MCTVVSMDNEQEWEQRRLGWLEVYENIKRSLDNVRDLMVTQGMTYKVYGMSHGQETVCEAITYEEAVDLYEDDSWWDADYILHPNGEKDYRIE